MTTLLISGDVHCGWLNSAALRILGLPGAGVHDAGAPMNYEPWFALPDRLDEVPGTRDLRESGYRQVLTDMLARSVTGMVDMSRHELVGGSRPLANASADDVGPGRPTRGAAPYPGRGLPRQAGAPDRQGTAHRDRAAGLTALGRRLPGAGPGPLKVIADESMGSGSALTRVSPIRPSWARSTPTV